jgi:hypothetical protein
LTRDAGYRETSRAAHGSYITQSSPDIHLHCSSWGRGEVKDVLVSTVYFPADTRHFHKANAGVLRLSQVHLSGRWDLHEGVENVILDVSTTAGKLPNPSGSVLAERTSISTFSK